MDKSRICHEDGGVDIGRLSGLQQITGVNQRQLSHYINGVKKPSEKTVRKIENRMHVLANELSAVRIV